MSQPVEPSREFAMAEYHEAANAYFKGVDIGYTSVKSYITINGLFAALIGALAEPKSGVLSSMSEMVKLVPWFALVASFALFVALPHYFRHLENCRKRCEEIETVYGGLLFTRLGRIAHRRSSFNSGLGLIIIIGSIVSFWLYFAMKLQNPNFQLWKAISDGPVGTTIMRFF